MKRTLLLAGALCVLALPVVSRAQDLPQTDSSAQNKPQMRTPDQIMKMYGKQLSLTDEQKTQLKPIIADRQAKLEALRGDTSTRPRDKMKTMKSIAEESDAKINAILTPDQQKKYAGLEEQQKEKRKERQQAKKQGSAN